MKMHDVFLKRTCMVFAMHLVDAFVPTLGWKVWWRVANDGDACQEKDDTYKHNYIAISGGVNSFAQVQIVQGVYDTRLKRIAK